MKKINDIPLESKKIALNTKKLVIKQGNRAKNGIKRYLKKLFKILKRNEMAILPGQLAFSLVLSFFPLISLVGLICSFFSIPLLDFFYGIREFLPTEVFNLLKSYLETEITGVNVMYILLGVFMASNGLRSVISSCNTLYNIKNKHFFLGWIKAFFLTILLMIILLVSLLALAFGDSIFNFIMGLFENNSLVGNIYYIFKLLKWPIALILIYVVIKIIYMLAPDRKVTNKFAKRGAMFTTLGWLVVTAIYSYYANNLANYNRFYGNISNIIILMVWIYIISYIFVIGIGINANDYLEEIDSDK